MLGKMIPPKPLPLSSTSNVDEWENQVPVNYYQALMQSYIRTYLAWILGGATFGAGVTAGISRLSGGSVPRGAAAGAVMGGLAGYWLRKKTIENNAEAP